MNKTKLTALCLAALLSCTALMGCQSKPAEGTSPLPEGAVTTPVSPEEMQDLIDQGVIPDPNETGEAATPQNIEPAPYEKGVIEGNVYRNEAAGLTLRIPTGWSAKSDYDLATLMGVTYDFEDQTANLAEISKLADIYDMMATDITEDSSIIVLMQDLGQHGQDDKNSTEYLDVMKDELKSDNAAFEFSEITDVSYSGNTYSMMKVVITPNEGTEVTQYYFLREANGRMLTVLMTFPSADPINPDTIFA